MNLKIFRIDLSAHFLEDMQAIIANFSKVVAIKDISYQYTLKGADIDIDTMTVNEDDYILTAFVNYEDIELSNATTVINGVKKLFPFDFDSKTVTKTKYYNYFDYEHPLTIEKGEPLDSITVSDILCDHGYYCSPRQVQEALELEN